MPPPEELREMIWQVKVIIWIINIIVIIIIIVIVVIKSTISLSRCLAASGGQSRSVLNTTASQLQKYVTVTTITIALVTTMHCHHHQSPPPTPPPPSSPSLPRFAYGSLRLASAVVLSGTRCPSQRRTQTLLSLKNSMRR